MTDIQAIMASMEPHRFEVHLQTLAEAHPKGAWDGLGFFCEIYDYGAEEHGTYILNARVKPEPLAIPEAREAT